MAITTSRVPAGADAEVIELLLVDLASGAVSTLPSAGPGDHTATWSPDGTRVAFISARNGVPQVVVARPDDAAPRMITSLAGAASGPAGWSPDGARLVFPAARGRTIDPGTPGAPYRITRAVHWADGIGALDDPPQLVVVDAATGVAQPLTDDEWRWSLPRWSPDGRTIAACVSHDPIGRRRGQHIRLVDTTTRRIAEPRVPGGFATVPAWLHDGHLVVLSVQPEGRPLGSTSQLHLVDPGGAARPIHDGAPFALGGNVYADNASGLCVDDESALAVGTIGGSVRVFVRHHDGGRTGISQLTLPAEWSVVLDGQRTATPLGVAGGELIVTGQAADRPPHLLAVDLVGDRPDITRLRPVGDRLFDTPEPMTADVRRFRITIDEPAGPIGLSDPADPARSGSHRVDAWLLVPPGAREPLPTVLMIHGGPHAAFGEAFSLDAQALCAAGFGVLSANPRGSTGSGDAFAHAVHGDWAGAPVRDLLAVLDHCIDLGWVDGDRVGVTGNSYGGYLTAWLACTTDRFGAAVASNPVTDLLSMFGTSDIGATFLPGHLGATPIDDPAAYLRWSPMMQAHRCTTPMLFVVCGDDRRCPPSQSFELHRALHAHGTPSEVLMLPGEAHEGTTYGSPAARLAHDDALVEWMERWLLA